MLIRSFPLPAVARHVLMVLILLSIPGRSFPATFLNTLGFEDDVDLVTSENGEFLVICEEVAGGGAARVRVMDLSLATGQPLALALTRDLPGFEQGVDPIAVSPAGVAGNIVLVPFESSSGLESGVLMLRLNDAGGVLEEVRIDTGDLGFRADVDGFLAPYPTLMAFFPLESRDETVHGVLAIDVNPIDAGADGINAFGSCTLLSTDGRAGCVGSDVDERIRRLVDGVDPVGYRMADRVRFALPAVRADGLHDLLLYDFDSTFEPPAWMGTQDVRDINAATARPTNFPGFERDVDLALFTGPAICGLPQLAILVPVEETDGAGGGDLYLLDEFGTALWTYSHDSGASAATLPGYQIGVDPLVMCDLPGGAASRIAVPVESPGGTFADVLLVNLATGALIARVANPAINPGLTIPGYEVGVDLLRWTDDYFVAPVERADHVGGLLVFDNSGVLQSQRYSTTGLGFILSVDPIVAPLPDADRTLFVPMGKDNLDDSDIIRFTSPPSLALGAVSLETLNPSLTLGGFRRDVDLGLIEKIQPGQAFLYVPEEATSGAIARVRFEDVPSPGRQLVIACPGGTGAPAPSLYFVRVSTGLVTTQFHDLFGLESGLDVAHGRGSATSGNPPAQGVPPGYDADTDPTLGWIPGGPSASPDRPGVSPPRWKLEIPTPFSAPGRIRMTSGEQRADDVEVTLVDVTGRTVRALYRGPFEPGSRDIAWDGRNDAGTIAASGVYFVRVRSVSGAVLAHRMVVVR